MTQGPNIKRLIAHKMATIMVPPGGGVAAAIAALTTAGKISQAAREATEWVEQAIALVKPRQIIHSPPTKKSQVRFFAKLTNEGINPNHLFHRTSKCLN